MRLEGATTSEDARQRVIFQMGSGAVSGAEQRIQLMRYNRESRANIAIDRDYYRKLEAAKSPRPPEAYGRIVLTPEEHNKIRAAMDRAKADGRPIDKLSLKIIKDILKDRF